MKGKGSIKCHGGIGKKGGSTKKIGTIGKGK